MLILNDVKLDIDYTKKDMFQILSSVLKLEKNDIKNYQLVKLSVDARNKNNIFFVANFLVSLNICEDNFCAKNKNVRIYNNPQNYSVKTVNKSGRVIVVGFGPAGMFAGLMLARSGLKPIIIERGQCVEDRIKTVNEFWQSGKLNRDSNVQFGEGGAGTFSDGKLTTGIKDSRKAVVLKTFVEFGADASIEYLSKPHIGTDKLAIIVKNIRSEILKLGGKILFNHKMMDMQIDNGKVNGIIVESCGKQTFISTDELILAIGHSARDTFKLLNDKGLDMQAKAFSIGVRIEHLQSEINKSQYGKFFDSPFLPPSEYKLACHLDNGRSVYTFCMCPGGQVVASQSDNGEVVTNGMSEFLRDKKLCNSAVLVNVTPEDFASDNPLAGIEFQQKYERLAFLLAGNNAAPVQLVGDFLQDKNSIAFKGIVATYKPSTRFCELKECLPKFVTESLKKALKIFDNKLRGFANPNAVLTGVETRSSSPVKIERGELLEANIRGIYPCGEGCGYAGGIMSSAVDGIKCAETVIEKYI